MAYRFVSFWLVALGLSCWLVACGGGSTADNNSGFDATAGSDGSHHGHEDVTLKTGSDAQKLIMTDGGSGMTCTKKTCSELHAGCGFQGDGCGGMLDCGQCTAPETCGGGGLANQCGAPNPDAGDGSTPIPTGPLTIAPLNKVISVTYGQTTPSVTYTAEVGGQSVAASFSIDLGQIGTVNASTGVMTPSGLVGGVAHVTATFGMQTVSTPLTVAVQLTSNGAPLQPDGGTDAGSNAGGNGGVGGSPAGGPVSMATQTLLTQTTPAPTSDASLSWLYPYNNTVWPQGILAPLLQWKTTKTYDSVYIQLNESGFNYQGFFSAPVAGQPFINVPLLQSVWDTLVYSNAGDPVTVTLTFSSGGVAYGPITETWVIAQGSLTGTVYYQSYGTALAINFPGSNGYPNFGGATLAIKHGATSPVLVAGKPGLNGTNSNCRVCHSVAAGGSTLITQHGDNYEQSSAYALTAANAETVMPPVTPAATVSTFAFAAVSPDGMFLLSNAGAITGTNPPSTSGLFSVPAGTPIAATGLPVGFAAATPTFSPDGTQVAYNEWSGDKASLASMPFDSTTNTFSTPVKLHTPAAGTADVFPAFLPTNNAVVFERELSDSGGGFGATWQQNRGELWWVDLATQNAVPLTTLNGSIGGTTYLPNYGTNHATDTTLNYEPTVNPVPSGGYAWVVFTSRRLYGNVATQDPFLSDPRDYNATVGITTKKLWVAAIDLNAPAGTDPSHPAFYLPAQELHACNSRGYWVVDPCEAAGSSCLTGDQCCTGYCGPGDAGGFVCGTQPAGCAVLGNKCTMASDCCGAATGISCIDGFCAVPSQPHDAGGCTPTTCAKLGFNCGPAGDGCGGLLECGTCVAPATCGGDGTSGICGTSKGPS